MYCSSYSTIRKGHSTFLKCHNITDTLDLRVWHLDDPNRRPRSHRSDPVLHILNRALDSLNRQRHSQYRPYSRQFRHSLRLNTYENRRFYNSLHFGSMQVVKLSTNNIHLRTTLKRLPNSAILFHIRATVLGSILHLLEGRGNWVWVNTCPTTMEAVLVGAQWMISIVRVFKGLP